MSNVTVYIVVEGQTEQTFIRDILAPEMGVRGIFLQAVLIGRPGNKGGDIRFERAKRDICHFLRQRNDIYVTTMFDYYGIADDWPGKGTVNKIVNSGAALSSGEKAEMLESETRKVIMKSCHASQVDRRFIPYIAMHEFEALLFSDSGVLSDKTGIDSRKIKAILDEFSRRAYRPQLLRTRRSAAFEKGARKPCPK